MSERGTGLFAQFGFGKGKVKRVCVACGKNFLGADWAFKCFADARDDAKKLAKDMRDAAPEMDRTWWRNRP